MKCINCSLVMHHEQFTKASRIERPKNKHWQYITGQAENVHVASEPGYLDGAK